MRKFLIYLTSIITVVCLGLVTYYFIKIDERISMSTKEIYCNVGDVISVDTLGIEIVKPSRKTTFDYTTGVEEIVYDADTNCYVAVSGGNVEIEVKTSNKEYASFKIAVHIGDGEIVPYFVNNEQTLSKMSQYGLNRNYLLMSDIVLTDEFAPIGTDSLGFSGIFDGNGHKISGLKVNSNKEHAGLFTRIEQGGEIKNLQITDFTFNGEFDHVGALAGSCNGTILNVGANGISIVNDKATTVMGGLIGDCTGATIIGACVEDTTINNSSLTTSDSYVGGLIGLVNGEQRSTIVRACYASGVTLDLPSDITTGGLVGKFIVGGTKDSSIQQSYASTTYSNPTTTNYGAFLGEFSANSTLTTIASNDTNQDVTYESLMIRYLVGNLAVVGIDNFADTDLVAKDNFYKDVTSGSKYFDKATGN